MPGTLFVVATPLGNLGDITLRAIETLRSSDTIACEDTRHSEKLLTHLDIHKPLLRYDEHTHVPASRKILDWLRDGKNVSLITDAGTPAVSDPGARLIKEVLAAGVRVIPIPGPSSPMAALSASGLVGEGFLFLGFLPRRPGRARRLLQEGRDLSKTMVILESPFRVEATLEMIGEIDPDATVVVAREMTKIHEEFMRGSPAQVKDQLKRPPKGEFVVLIQPSDRSHLEPDTI